MLANNIKYSYATSMNWENSTTYTHGAYGTLITNYVDVPNGGNFSGMLVFQVPKSATAFVMDYQQPTSNSLNISWTKT